MGRRLLTGVVGLVVAGAVVVVAPVASASPSELFVDNTASAGCSNSGSGTQSQPYCTIGAALAVVQAGQTVTVVAGLYNESVTIDKSGTAGSPITLRHSGTAVALLYGDKASLTIDGQHDVSVSDLVVEPTAASSSPLVTLRNSTRLAIYHVSASPSPTAPVGIQLTGVTDSSLDVLTSRGPYTVAGISLDSGTTRNVFRVPTVINGGPIGIDDAGPDNSFIVGRVNVAAGDGIAIHASAANTVVVDFTLLQNKGAGIHNAGASGTAITNNTLKDNCGPAGIQVDGDSSGVSVQNNVLDSNGGIDQSLCAGSPSDGVDIGVYGNAVHGTVVDYNAVTQGPGGDHAYAWNTQLSSLTEFRAVSGQGAHDAVVVPDPLDVSLAVYEDSANSAAPGYQAKDGMGRPREDDPAVPNTGAGPIAYADRGALETVRLPYAGTVTVSFNPFTLTATAGASAAVSGFGAIVSYTFDFGDGTPPVTQSSPVMTRRLPGAGVYLVMVTVTDVYGMTSKGGQQVVAYRAYCGPTRCPMR
jgi:parallel beta-helix repeat protein